jgi:hypothetical protein
MSGKDRRKYLTATNLTQSLLDWCADNLECRIEMAVEIESPDGVIYASDRNKYIGGQFYQALLKFPVISRTVGEWLAPDLQFSSLTLELSNVDGRFNKYLPGGDSFGGWIGKNVMVKVGLAEVQSSYKTLFSGKITDIGGFKRSVSSITVIARDKFDTINAAFPATIFSKSAFPKMAENTVGKIVPIIYGAWKEVTDPDPANVPTFCVNGNDPMVDRKDRQVTITLGSPAVFDSNENNLEDDDIIKLATGGSLPYPFTVDYPYYVVNSLGNATFELSETLGGPSIGTSGTQTGNHKFQAHETGTYRNVTVIISHNNLKELDVESVYLLRNEIYNLVPSTDIENVIAGNKGFDVKQKTGALWVDNGDGTTVEYTYDSNDVFLVKCVGEDLGADTDNIVMQAKHILKSYGGLVDADFDTNWATYKAKYSPAQSNIRDTKSRAWIGEQQAALQYALSMLEQVRLEAFVSREQLLRINSLHFEDFNATPGLALKNWDIEKGSFQTSIDEQNNFNRAQGVYAFSPYRNENALSTLIYKNQAAIDQAGKQISKRLVFPNLYEQNRVIDNLSEILKLASSTIEKFEANLTWRMLLFDIGDFVKSSISIGSVEIENVPCLIREIGIDPAGLKLPVKMWSFQMCPFNGWVPTYSGIVGGYAANIESET